MDIKQIGTKHFGTLQVGGSNERNLTLAERASEAARVKHNAMVDLLKQWIENEVMAHATKQELLINTKAIIGAKFSTTCTMKVVDDVKTWLRKEGFSIEGDPTLGDSLRSRRIPSTPHTYDPDKPYIVKITWNY